LNNYTLHIYLDLKVNTYIQSVLDKMLEEQLRQHMIIDTLKEGNDEIKCEIFENRKLLQNLFTMLTTGSLNMITEQMQEKPKQRLKRKDTKHMWWDVSINLLMKLTVLNILCFSLF
jgi:hypothetical protein